MNQPLYLCCHIAEFTVQAMLRLRPNLRTAAVAVLEGEAPWEKVCSRNRHAMRMGVENGITRVQLETLGAVNILHRSVVEERSAAAAMLDCTRALSPLVEDSGGDGVCTLFADIAGTERLLGAPAVVMQMMMRQAEALGFSATVTVSSNLHTALTLARFGRSMVVAPGKESEALAALPVEVIEPSAQHRETLMHWGLRSLRELAELPAESLVTRFGQEGKRLHQLARGEYPHLFRPVEEVPALKEVIEFDTAVEQIEPLLFVLQPMLEQLLVRARTHAMAIELMALTLSLESGTAHEIRVRPAIPSDDKALLLKLLQLEMQAHPAAAPVTRLILAAEAAASKKVQLGLFSPPLPESTRLDVTLARLRAMVGEDRVGSPVLQDTHRTDAFRIEPFCVGERGRGKQQEAKLNRTTTAVRQLRPPEPVHVVMEHNDFRAVHFRGERFVIRRAYGPWVSNGAWWSTAPWTVEQWDVLALNEQTDIQLACCLVRDRAQGCWFIEALYD